MKCEEEHLLETGSTQANPAGPPQSISFQVTADNGRRFLFTQQDYAGRFIEPMDQRTADGMADEARRYLQSCHAVLTLADARAIDRRVSNAIDIPDPADRSWRGFQDYRAGPIAWPIRSSWLPASGCPVSTAFRWDGGKC